MDMKALALLASGFFLFACGDFKMESGELTARTASAPLGPNCASCHAYPLTDTNHTYHLKAGSNKLVNGTITCLDCHSTALAFKTVILPDSIFKDSVGNEWSALDLPKDTGIRTFPLVRVDTVTQDHAIPLPPRPGKVPDFQEYVTSLAHMNGKVDVVFHKRVSRPDEFEGLKAEFNPKTETCSAMSCHPGGISPEWRFASLRRNLIQLEGDSGKVP